MTGLTVGIVGCGQIGTMYSKYLDAHRLICVDTITERAWALASQAADAQVVGSVSELLSLGCDAALVTSATTTHPQLVEQLLAAGVPVLCEKPLATDLAETRRLGELAESSGVPLWVGFHRHFDAGIADLRARTISGELGKVHLLRLMSHDMTPPPTARLRESGTVFTDLMLHDFDLVRWLTGRSITRVNASGSALSRPELAGIGDFDTAAAMLHLDDGSLAVITAGRWQPLGYDVRAEILGERGNLAAGAESAVFPGDLSTPHHSGYWDRFGEAYRAQVVAFLAEAAGGAHDTAAGNWRDSHFALQSAIAADHSAHSAAASVAL